MPWDIDISCHQFVTFRAEAVLAWGAPVAGGAALTQDCDFQGRGRGGTSLWLECPSPEVVPGMARAEGQGQAGSLSVGGAGDNAQVRNP